MRVRVRVRARVCVCARARVCVCARACVRVRARVLAALQVRARPDTIYFDRVPPMKSLNPDRIHAQLRKLGGDVSVFGVEPAAISDRSSWAVRDGLAADDSWVYADQVGGHVTYIAPGSSPPLQAVPVCLCAW